MLTILCLKGLEEVTSNMKKAILILSAMLLSSCSINTDELGQNKTESVYLNQMPVLDKMQGEYTSIEGSTLNITKEAVESLKTGYIELSQVSVLVSQDCYIDIYLSDGTHIRIRFYWLDNAEVDLYINGVYIETFYKEAPTTEQPINNM